MITGYLLLPLIVSQACAWGGQGPLVFLKALKCADACAQGYIHLNELIRLGFSLNYYNLDWSLMPPYCL